MTNGNIIAPVTGLLPLLVGVSIIGITIEQVAKIGEDVQMNTREINRQKRR